MMMENFAMKDYRSKIIFNKQIANDIYKLRVQKDINLSFLAGQFIEIRLDNFYLRRPFSIAYEGDDYFDVIYKIFGCGTKFMSKNLKSGDEISYLAPLGNSFKLTPNSKILILGGGVGVPPLYFLANQAKKLNCDIEVCLGFLDKNSIILENEFKKITKNVCICTISGDYGIKGTILDGLDNFKNDLVYACGPNAMLRAIQNKFVKGFISLEARMGCGFGVCNGCVVKTNDGLNKRVCTDGAIFEISEVKL